MSRLCKTGFASSSVTMLRMACESHGSPSCLKTFEFGDMAGLRNMRIQQTNKLKGAALCGSHLFSLHHNVLKLMGSSGPFPCLESLVTRMPRHARVRLRRRSWRAEGTTQEWRTAQDWRTTRPNVQLLVGEMETQPLKRSKVF